MTTLDGIPGITPAFSAFVQMVRTFFRDFPELNRLVNGEESSDRQVAWAVVDAISDFNGTPPFSTYRLEDLLQQDLQNLLLRMTCISLLESIGQLQTRNQLNYTEGGQSVGVNDKTPLIMNWLNYFRTSVEQKKERVKVALNIEQLLNTSNSGVMSEYWFVNSSYSGL